MIYTMKEWVESMRNTVIRYLIYKRFLPEGAHMTTDEFTSATYEFGYINSLIDTGHGWLVEIDGVDRDDYERTGTKSYYNLNEIRIEVFDYDNQKECDDEDDGCEQ